MPEAELDEDVVGSVVKFISDVKNGYDISTIVLK